MVPKPKVPKEEVKESKLPAEERLTWILDRAIEDPMKGIITFIGPTQQGKTHFIREYLMKRGYTFLMINPQNDLPEDLGGWPNRKNNILSFTQPSFVPAHLTDKLNDPSTKIAIYIDEGDKGRDDTLSCFLTLLNPEERRIRDTYFPPHIPIIMSMNERNTLPDTFVARCLFIAFPQDDMNIGNRPDLQPVKHFANELCPPPSVSFPARPDTPGSLHKLVRWMKHREFWADKGIKWAIVRGLFSEKGAAVVMARLGETIPHHGKEWAEAVKSTDVNEHIIEILSAADYAEQVEILTILANRSNNDATGELNKVFTAFLNCQEALLAVKRPEQLIDGKAKLKVALTIEEKK